MYQNIITASQVSNTLCVGPHTHLWTLRVYEYFILSSELTNRLNKLHYNNTELQPYCEVMVHPEKAASTMTNLEHTAAN